MNRVRPHIDSYDELRAVRFASVKQIDKAIELFYTDEELKGFPFDIADGMTLIVPLEAVLPLRQKRLRFNDTHVLKAGEVSPRRLAKLRAEQGVF